MINTTITYNGKQIVDVSPNFEVTMKTSGKRMLSDVIVQGTGIQDDLLFQCNVTNNSTNPCTVNCVVVDDISRHVVLSMKQIDSNSTQTVNLPFVQEHGYPDDYLGQCIITTVPTDEVVVDSLGYTVNSASFETSTMHIVNRSSWIEGWPTDPVVCNIRVEPKSAE